MQEGIYVGFSDDLSDPRSWTQPRKIYDGGRWYPQVIGLQKGETDKEAGQVARFFMGGNSEWEIVFLYDRGLEGQVGGHEDVFGTLK
jgi:hypothetical protein